jgi:hypothetical protein
MTDDDMATQLALSELLKGKKLYLLRQRNIDVPKLPLDEIEFGIVIGGSVVFSAVPQQLIPGESWC